MKKTNELMKSLVIIPLILFSTVSLFADTDFLGGDLTVASNWSGGLPQGQTAIITNTGFYTGKSQIDTWVDGSTVTVGGGAVLTLAADFSAYNCPSFTVNDATINCEDDLFVDKGNLILNEGSVTKVNDDWEANDHAGRITVNGGTHSSGTNSENYVGAQGNATRIGCGINFRGGTVIAGDFRFQINSSSSISGGAILTSATPATTIVDLSGDINFISDWNGLWEVGSFLPGDWEYELIDNANITFDGSPIDAASFSNNFLVVDNGTTLKLASPKPIITVTYFTGGDLLNADNWTNGLPAHQYAFVNSNGYYNGISQDNQWLLDSTVAVDGGATLSLTNDLAVFGSKLFTVDNATINCSSNFACDGGKVVLNENSITTADADWGTVGNGGRITVNGGTHSSGTNTENYAGALSTNLGSGIDFIGGTVTAGSFKFMRNSSSSIKGDAILASGNPATAFTEMDGMIDFISGWNGSWEVASFSSNDWEIALTSHTNFTLDGIAIDGARFATNFLVEGNGTTLKYSFPTFVTHFLGGDLLDADNWSRGLPAYQVASINSNGYYDGVLQNNTWIAGARVTVGGGAVLNLDQKLAVSYVTSFTVNDATINCSDDFFCDRGNVILNAGSVTIANDDWEANAHTGRITVNGGTHSSGTNSESFVGAQGDATKVGCGIDFRGGTVIAGDFRFQAYSSSSIGGGAILTSATPATTIADLSGNMNFVSGWTGYWEVASFSPGAWEALLTNKVNITLDNTPIDSATFVTDFLVSDDGTTLSLLIPEPGLIGILILAIALIKRKM